jgi:hypothetical protein
MVSGIHMHHGGSFYFVAEYAWNYQGEYTDGVLTLRSTVNWKYYYKNLVCYWLSNFLESQSLRETKDCLLIHELLRILHSSNTNIIFCGLVDVFRRNILLPSSVTLNILMSALFKVMFPCLNVMRFLLVTDIKFISKTL